MRSKRDKTIVDPTPTQIYLRAKAERLKITIVEPKNNITNDNKNNWKRVFAINDGWTKTLQNLPAISNTEMPSLPNQ